MAPALFVSHGAPTFALKPGELGSRLAALGRTLAGIRAVLVVSPHWMTHGVRVMAAPRPATVHDFGGFPEPLYRLDYAAPGTPELAREALQLLLAAGFEAALDERRGRDHGAWVPLLHLLPKARVPVFQVSLPAGLDTAGALRLGQALAPLRARGVLVLGSGSLTHNLYEVGARAADAPYALAFARWVREAVLARDAARLLDYRRLAPFAERAHPTEEHFLPLLVALGATAASEAARVIEGGITYGVLSMESYAWGAPPVD